MLVSRALRPKSERLTSLKKSGVTVGVWWTQGYCWLFLTVSTVKKYTAELPSFYVFISTMKEQMQYDP